MNIKITQLFVSCMIALALSSPLFAEDSKQITASYIKDVIKLDGKLDESVWQGAQSGSDFQQFFPLDSVKANHNTTFKVLYSDTHLYIGVVAERAQGEVVISSLKRDFGATTNDNISILLDTFSNGDTAYFFGITPYGVRREGLVSAGGVKFNNSWDTKWDGEGSFTDDHFTVELAIPFTSMKFPKDAASWRFRVYRWNNQSSEQDTWIKVPQTLSLSNLGYMGKLNFEKPLKDSGSPISIIPYFNAKSVTDFEGDLSGEDIKVGADAKIAFGDGLNLDITVNPDFSTAEADDVLTNLTRFELRREEKRQFFIDNSDLFESWGNIDNDSRPFFSRRIGLAKTPNANLIENDIVGGVRLSGNINKDWRVGFLDIQTDMDEANQIASFNNMMFALQSKVGERSSAGVFVVDRQAIDGEEFIDKNDRSNRVFGVDYNLNSADGLWSGKAFYHHSTQEIGDAGSAAQATVSYTGKTWEFTEDVSYVGQNFRADIGWVPRKDVLKWGNGLRYNIYPDSENINDHQIGLLTVLYWKPSDNNLKTDHIYRMSFNTTFKDRSTLNSYIQNNYVRLGFDFDPTRSGAIPLSAGEEFEYNQFHLQYTSSTANRLTYNASATIGEFFNGDIESLGAEIGYRMQPWGQINFRADYNHIDLPAPHGSADIWLATAKAEIAFNRELFWNTLIQYSSQGKTLGINSRLQWRFAPLSDLYLVYNDSYETDFFSPRFRSINLKVNYWFDM